MKGGACMKVLMFGWEFPPKIYGGLAVASYGITKGLSLQTFFYEILSVIF